MQALREAEQYRDQANDPALKGDDLDKARELRDQKQAAVREAER